MPVSPTIVRSRNARIVVVSKVKKTMQFRSDDGQSANSGREYAKEMGHIARSCKEERAPVERVEVKCVNCSAVGHRARDCPEPRRDQFACRNCG